MKDGVTLLTLIFICTAGFFAAFVDSIAGGGGLISVPAFMLINTPAPLAAITVLGTNKFSSTTASFTSSLKFARSGKVKFALLRYLIPLTIVGATIGVFTAKSIDNKYLQPLVLVLILCVGIYTIFSKSLGVESRFSGFTKRNIALGAILAFSLGFYDGFFGPGTGSFLIFGLIKIYGFDFVDAAGNAKVLNFVSNITSLVLFAASKNINYKYGIPVAVFMIIGARLGTRLALKNGVKLIKPIFVIMSLAVAIKILFQIL